MKTDAKILSELYRGPLSSLTPVEQLENADRSVAFELRAIMVEGVFGFVIAHGGVDTPVPELVMASIFSQPRPWLPVLMPAVGLGGALAGGLSPSPNLPSIIAFANSERGSVSFLHENDSFALQVRIARSGEQQRRVSKSFWVDPSIVAEAIMGKSSPLMGGP